LYSCVSRYWRRFATESLVPACVVLYWFDPLALADRLGCELDTTGKASVPLAIPHPKPSTVAIAPPVVSNDRVMVLAASTR